MKPPKIEVGALYRARPRRGVPNVENVIMVCNVRYFVVEHGPESIEERMEMSYLNESRVCMHVDIRANFERLFHKYFEKVSK